MRSLYVAVGLALCSANALAADFGIGVSARSDDGYLYVPIDVSKSFRIEPSVRYGTSELTFSADGDTDQQETETWELGVGLFGLKQVTEAAHVYFGARLAYVETESTVVQPTLFDVVYSRSKQDGYRVGPTLGFEYIFGGHFSIGGEASYTFLDLEGESRSTLGDFELSRTETEQKSNGTQTRLIFRYMF
ncbi:hypothetical protein JM946_24385 [Steroidobacter sp. S1-65]|uniref:Outer membrane protein beta-barrel domain-containing protein n=1 Tax=Steroidobacter gossypii TaxID=2805490 RepID=A0ABS1X3S9_9GAMM|nr:hypothetical protein [Steroidobacter gossypii]MBM0107884.1 hypothetical protein [Steroidobacter gossypii]